MHLCITMNLRTDLSIHSRTCAASTVFANLLHFDSSNRATNYEYFDATVDKDFISSNSIPNLDEVALLGAKALEVFGWLQKHWSQQGARHSLIVILFASFFVAQMNIASSCV